MAQAEVLQLSADPKGPVEGTVIESEIEPGLGRTSVILIRRGTLKKGDYLVCGHAFAKVRMLLNTGAILEDEKGKEICLNHRIIIKKVIFRVSTTVKHLIAMSSGFKN